MHFLKFAFATICLAVSCSAVAVSNKADRCPNAQVLTTEMIGRVNFTTFACPEDSPSAIKAVNSRSPQKRTSANVPRQFQNCAGGASDPECECAVLCNVLFCEGSSAVAPFQSDCNAIQTEFENVPGSFFVPEGTGVSATVGSCEAVWINESNGELEYCFENFGQLAAVQYTNCVIVDGGGSGGCIGDDFLWFFEFLIPGNSIFIP